MSIRSAHSASTFSASTGLSGGVSLNVIRLSRRTRSMVVFRPVISSQAEGSFGKPAVGQCSSALTHAS